MSDSIDRRRFLERAAAGGAAVAVAANTWADDRTPGEKIIVGVMGTGGRGTSLAKQFQQQPNCEVAYVCGVDKNRLGAATG